MPQKKKPKNGKLERTEASEINQLILRRAERREVPSRNQKGAKERVLEIAKRTEPENGQQGAVAMPPPDDESKKKAEGPMEVLTLRLPVGMLKCLRKHREETGQEITAFVRPLIEKALEKWEDDPYCLWWKNRVTWEKQVERLEQTEEMRQS